MVQNASLLKFEAIAPIEAIVHDFSVEMLKGVYSAFILDNDAEVIRLRSEVEKAIRAIEGSDSKEAIEILTKQMSKLKDVDNVSTAAEGFVFDYDDVTYKFTGNFAPVNQILGLFKYGRGNVPPLQKLDEQEGGRTVAVVPGAFKPPHKGHMQMVQHYADLADRVVVMVSPLARKTPSGKDIGFDVSKKIWEIYIRDAGLEDKVTVVRSPVNSPVSATYQFVENSDDKPELAQPGDTVIPGCSTKGGDEDRFKANFEKYAREGVSIADPLSCAFVAPPEALSARDFRAALDDGAGLERFIPQGVDPDDVLDVLGVKREPEAIDEAKATTYTLNVTYNSGKVVTVHKLGDDAMKRALLKISRRPMVKSVTVSPPPKSMLNKKVDEISTMAGGSVEGYAVGNKNKRSLIREEDPEDEAVEEILNYLLGKGALS
jgi:cytidyltransferase-like protein